MGIKVFKSGEEGDRADKPVGGGNGGCVKAIEESPQHQITKYGYKDCHTQCNPLTHQHLNRQPLLGQCKASLEAQAHQQRQRQKSRDMGQYLQVLL